MFASGLAARDLENPDPYRHEQLLATVEERQTLDAAHAGMQGGWTGTLDQLGQYLATA